MRNDPVFEDDAPVALAPARGTRPALALVFALFAVLASIALCSGAIVAHAPVAAVPLIAGVCVGCPLFAGWNAPAALAALHANRRGRALRRLRRALDQLPETEHPLGL